MPTASAENTPTTLLAHLSKVPVANVADAQRSFGIMHPSIRSYTPGLRLAGPAHTAKCYPGSIITVHKALLEAKPGEVLVVDGEGDERGAMWGELMTLQAKANHLAGIVIDGPFRDLNAVRQSGFPVFATGVNPRVGSNRRVGDTQVAVQCGGVVVNPGDFIVGDDDGVAVIPAGQVEALLKAVDAIRTKEIGLRKGIGEGQQLADMIGFRTLISGA